MFVGFPVSYVKNLPVVKPGDTIVCPLCSESHVLKSMPGREYPLCFKCREDVIIATCENRLIVTQGVPVMSRTVHDMSPEQKAKLMGSLVAPRAFAEGLFHKIDGLPARIQYGGLSALDMELMTADLCALYSMLTEVKEEHFNTTYNAK